MLFELLIVFALMALNGVFAGAEIAVLSVRKTRLAELGATLLERNRRRVRLTEPGRHFLEHARTVIAQVESRRDTAWSFAINAGLAQQQGIAPGAEVLLSIQKAAGCLLPAEQVTPPALAARSP